MKNISDVLKVTDIRSEFVSVNLTDKHIQVILKYTHAQSNPFKDMIAMTRLL